MRRKIINYKNLSTIGEYDSQAISSCKILVDFHYLCLLLVYFCIYIHFKGNNNKYRQKSQNYIYYMVNLVHEFFLLRNLKILITN